MYSIKDNIHLIFCTPDEVVSEYRHAFNFKTKESTTHFSEQFFRYLKFNFVTKFLSSVLLNCYSIYFHIPNSTIYSKNICTLPLFNQ